MDIIYSSSSYDILRDDNIFYVDVYRHIVVMEGPEARRKMDYSALIYILKNVNIGFDKIILNDLGELMPDQCYRTKIIIGF